MELENGRLMFGAELSLSPVPGHGPKGGLNDGDLSQPFGSRFLRIKPRAEIGGDSGWNPS